MIQYRSGMALATGNCFKRRSFQAQRADTFIAGGVSQRMKTPKVTEARKADTKRNPALSLQSVVSAFQAFERVAPAYRGLTAPAVDVSALPGLNCKPFLSFCRGPNICEVNTGG